MLASQSGKSSRTSTPRCSSTALSSSLPCRNSWTNAWKSCAFTYRAAGFRSSASSSRQARSCAYFPKTLRVTRVLRCSSSFRLALAELVFDGFFHLGPRGDALLVGLDDREAREVDLRRARPVEHRERVAV